jgi:pimeloyl-ACP methyl ester carboxylesterase
MGAESLATIQVDGAKIVYRRLGNGCPLLVLNGFAATSGDWDPLFIHGLASYSELILLTTAGSAVLPMTGSHLISPNSLMMPRM